MLVNYIKALKQEITIFIVVLLLSVLIVLASVMHLDEASEKHLFAEQRLDEAKRKYNEAIDRKLILKEYKSRYDKLEKLDIVGSENRIDWINWLDIIAKNEKIPYINYKIDKQLALVDSGIAVKYPGLTGFKSEMLLDMKLLHEGDMYTVLSELKLKAMGVFDISSCEIKKLNFISGSIVENKSGVNFSAKCTLNWYTFQPKST